MSDAGDSSPGIRSTPLGSPPCLAQGSAGADETMPACYRATGTHGDSFYPDSPLTLTRSTYLASSPPASQQECLSAYMACLATGSCPPANSVNLAHKGGPATGARVCRHMTWERKGGVCAWRGRARVRRRASRHDLRNVGVPRHGAGAARRCMALTRKLKHRKPAGSGACLASLGVMWPHYKSLSLTDRAPCVPCRRAIRACIMRLGDRLHPVVEVLQMAAV